MWRTTSRTRRPRRLDAALVWLFVVLAFVVASLRGPAIRLHEVGTARVTAPRFRAEEKPRVIAKSGKLQAPVARPARGEPPRANRAFDVSATTDGAALEAVAVLGSLQPSGAPGGAWIPAKKTHAELMVFLN